MKNSRKKGNESEHTAEVSAEELFKRIISNPMLPIPDSSPVPPATPITSDESADEEGDEEEYIEEGYERCPICNELNCPGAMVACAHWLCSGSSCGEFYGFTDADDFSDEVSTLASLVEELHLTKGKIQRLKSAPKPLKNLLMQMLEKGAHYWTSYDGVKAVYWETDGMLGDEGYGYYHLQAESLAKQIKKEAEEAVAWLEEHLESR